MSEVWKAYRQKSVERYLLHYLAYARAHKQATIEDYDKLEAENDNLLAAVQRASDNHNWGSLRQLVWALSADGEHGYLRVRGRWQSLRTMLELAVEAAIQENAAGDWLAFRINLASLLIDLGEFKTAQEMYGMVLPVLESIQMEGLLSTVHHHLGQIEQRQGRFANAAKSYSTSLQYAEASKDPGRIAVVNHSLGTLAHLQGHYSEARNRYMVTLSSWQEAGDQEGIAATLHNLGMLEQEQGDYARAREYYRQSLELEQSWDHKSGIASSLERLGGLAVRTGAYEEANHNYASSLEIRMALGDQRGIAELYHNQGLLAQIQGDINRARELYLLSLGIKYELGDPVGVARTRAQLGLLALESGSLDEADSYFQESLAIFQSENARAELADIYQQFGLLAQERGIRTTDMERRSDLFAQAEDHYRRSLQLDEEMGNQAGIAKSLHQLGSLSLAEGRLDNAKQLLDQSLEIKSRLGDRSGMARTLRELANLRLESGEKQLLERENRFEEARGVLDSAIQVYLDRGPEEPPYMTAERNALEEKRSASTRSNGEPEHDLPDEGSPGYPG